ncbi:MAG: hypothetical protein ABSE51_18420 [Terracidiphilus sp.]|jgi:hypothetical protein
MPEAVSLPLIVRLFSAMLSQRVVLQQGELALMAIGLLGKHPAGYGLLEGDRNSLLESAQEATPISVATVGFSRQCNKMAEAHWQSHFETRRG